MTEAVKDGITVNLVYDGRAAKVMLNQDKVRQIEEYYAQCELEGANEHQVEESQKAVAKMEVLLATLIDFVLLRRILSSIMKPVWQKVQL